ncbi:MAG: copper homeostasis protein CutC [Propioniciclava sp.]
MRPLLEVIAQTPADARNAEAGGADRIELVGSMAGGGLSPDIEMVEQVRATTSLPVRAMIRPREGFVASVDELALLKRQVNQVIEAGADGVVLGFLDQQGQVDSDVVGALVEDGFFPWTFHRAIDHAGDPDDAWETLQELPRLDQVLTAGSTQGVRQGLPSLLERADVDDFARPRLMAGGGLAPAHVGQLMRAGVRSFHTGSLVRPGGSFVAPVNAPLVEEWRDLLDDELSRLEVA